MGSKTRKALILCDTNIWIGVLNGETQTVQRVQSIGLERLAACTVTLAELMLGCSKAKAIIVSHELRKYPILVLDTGIDAKFRELIHAHHQRNSRWMPDALIAATALYHGLELCTLNRRDFDFIDGLVLYSQ